MEKEGEITKTVIQSKIQIMDIIYIYICIYTYIYICIYTYIYIYV